MSSISSIEGSDKENSTPNTLRISPGLKKRVIFSPLPSLLQPSVQSKPNSLRLPAKSVLKPPGLSSSPLSSPISEQLDPSQGNLLYMIDSAIRNLSGQDRASKLETYTTLGNIFRAFKTFPDRAQLLNRIGELFECVLADVMRLSEENPGTPDFPLNTKALKLAGFILFEPNLAAAVPVKLARALIEHSLTRMEVEKATKATSTQALWLWQTQQIPRAAMTTEMAERMLLASLKVDYPSVVINQERLSVFLRLLEQSRECMVRHVDRWLPPVINLLLDDNKQIRAAALRTALEAGRLLCRVPSVGRCVQTHLKKQIDGKSFVEITRERCKAIIQEQEGGLHVAHAWGAICTLSSSQNPERSKTLMDWMHVLQVVFNSPSTDNKVMAQSAWVRMIHYFGNNGDIIYRSKNLEYLTKPMLRMLTPESKVYDIVRMAAVNTVCSLLYALIRPSTSHAQLSSVWDDVVVPICSTMLEQHQKDSLQQRAVDILTALFEFKSLAPWTLDRLLESTVGTEDEVAPLDARWVKANVSKLGPLITTALQSSATRESKIHLWTVLQKSLRLASAKEIQISAETMEATAAICTIFREYWRAPLPSLGSPSSRLNEDISLRPGLLTDLVLISFDNFGSSPFTERTLSFHDDSDEITPASTPSVQDAGAPQRGTGLKFIFRLFQNPVSDSLIVPEYYNLLKSIVSGAVSGQKSLRKSLSLISQCQACMSSENTSIITASWRVLADVASSQILADVAKSSSSPSAAYPLAADIDERWSAIRSMLVFGMQMQQDRGAIDEWTALAEAGLKAVEKQHGAQAIAHKLVDPLIEAHSCLNVDNMLDYMQFFLNALRASKVHSKTSTLVLPGSAPRPGPRTFYDSLNKILVHQASEWQRYKISGQMTTFLASVSDYLPVLPQADVESAICAMTPGILAWLSRTTDGAKDLALAALKLIARMADMSGPCADDTQRIFAELFPVQSTDIRRAVVRTWNTTYGSAARIVYSDSLVAAINAAQLPIGTINLPTWPEQDPEVSQAEQASQASITGLTPKMDDLFQLKDTTKSRRRSRSQSISSTPGMSTRSQSEPSEQAKNDLPLQVETRKRKRRGANSPQVRSVDSSIIELSVPLNDHDSMSNRSASRSPRKRQKKPQRIQHKTPAVKHTRRSMTKHDHQTNDHDDDDVFSSPSNAAGTFTLRKRDFRNMSPDIPSDPISESSPSVQTRMRKLSTSQEPPIMGDLHLSIDRTALVIHEDGLLDDHDGPTDPPDELADEDIDEIASPLHDSVRDNVDSDELMCIQVKHDTEQSHETLEAIDEDLFILQLEQYRKSLRQGRPITPQRRERMGHLMKELTKLSGEVTEAYFAAAT